MYNELYNYMFTTPNETNISYKKQTSNVTFRPYSYLLYLSYSLKMAYAGAQNMAEMSPCL